MWSKSKLVKANLQAINKQRQTNMILTCSGSLWNDHMLWVEMPRKLGSAESKRVWVKREKSCIKGAPPCSHGHTVGLGELTCFSHPVGLWSVKRCTGSWLSNFMHNPFNRFQSSSSIVHGGMTASRPGSAPIALWEERFIQKAALPLQEPFYTFHTAHAYLSVFIKQYGSTCSQEFSCLASDWFDPSCWQIKVSESLMGIYSRAHPLHLFPPSLVPFSYMRETAVNAAKLKQDSRKPT